ncbi:hypothetical protein GW17_00042995 [Ensete ventricosum]|nr:hypothetical protein GW17_00042995 [Ensete ventricosum]
MARRRGQREVLLLLFFFFLQTSPRAGTKFARGWRGRLRLAGQDGARYFFSSSSSFFKRLLARGQSRPRAARAATARRRGRCEVLLLLFFFFLQTSPRAGAKFARGRRGRLRLAGENSASRGTSFMQAGYQGSTLKLRIPFPRRAQDRK